MTEVTSDDQRANDLIARINKILVEYLGIDADKITKESDIADDFGADSLDMIELIMAVEEEFGIEVPDDEAEKVKTVDDAYGLVARRVAPPRGQA